MSDTESPWYCVSAQGLPMLCASKEDAEREAARNDKVWPKGAPHRAVQLCDAAERDRLRAELDQLRPYSEALNARCVADAEEIGKLRADVRELVECLERGRSAVRTHQASEFQSDHPSLAAFAFAATALLAKHNPLQALADNAREMGLSYEGESDGK